MLVLIAGLIGVAAALGLWKRPRTGRELRPDQLRAMLGEDAPLIIDVREPGEYAQGHIPGAVPFPLGGLANRLGEIPRDRPIVTVCLRGRRSRTAAAMLEKAGFARVSSLAGGMSAWPYEVERTPDGGS